MAHKKGHNAYMKWIVMSIYEDDITIVLFSLKNIFCRKIFFHAMGAAIFKQDLKDLWTIFPLVSKGKTNKEISVNHLNSMV